MFTFIVTDKVGSQPVQDFACHAVEFNSENSRGYCECLNIESLMDVFFREETRRGQSESRKTAEDWVSSSRKG